MIRGERCSERMREMEREEKGMVERGGGESRVSDIEREGDSSRVGD